MSYVIGKHLSEGWVYLQDVTGDPDVDLWTTDYGKAWQFRTDREAVATMQVLDIGDPVIFEVRS